jgi:hypothetical protein
MILMNTSNVAGQPGYRPDLCTGALASLAASGTTTQVFDLDHENWMNQAPGPGVQAPNSRGWRKICTVLLALANGVTSTGGSVKVYFSDDGTATNQVPGMASYNNAGGQMSYSGDLALACMQLLVPKRFMRVVITNGTTPQGATTSLAVSTMDM